jgi:hypothetical protein
MDNYTFKAPLRLTLLLLAVSLAISVCGAQSTKTAPEPANAPAAQSAAAQANNAQLTPPRGKRRGLTNEMRKAAAIRNADRKAHARASGNSTTNQIGGRQ